MLFPALAGLVVVRPSSRYIGFMHNNNAVFGQSGEGAVAGWLLVSL